MGFNPGTGMTPNDWVEQEARREERLARASSNPHGREISPTARRVTGWILGLAALALVVYALLGWLGWVPIPGFSG